MPTNKRKVVFMPLRWPHVAATAGRSIWECARTAAGVLWFRVDNYDTSTQQRLASHPRGRDIETVVCLLEAKLISESSVSIS